MPGKNIFKKNNQWKKSPDGIHVKNANIDRSLLSRHTGSTLTSPPLVRPMFGRGAGAAGRGFDARQKIGANDVRQRIGLGAGESRHRPHGPVGLGGSRHRPHGPVGLRGSRHRPHGPVGLRGGPGTDHTVQ